MKAGTLKIPNKLLSCLKAGTLKFHYKLLSWLNAGTLKTDNCLSWPKAGSLKTDKLLFWLKAGSFKTGNLLSWLFISCTLLMLASVIRMWSHWREICASLGFYHAGGALAAVTGAALIVAWWLNTGNK
ncbi:MAG: hypothetical protein ACREC9_03640 [Methylocella sp.]